MRANCGALAFLRESTSTSASEYGAGVSREWIMLSTWLSTASRATTSKPVRARIGQDAERFARANDVELRDHLLHQWCDLLRRGVGQHDDAKLQLRAHPGDVQLLDQRLHEREIGRLGPNNHAAGAGSATAVTFGVCATTRISSGR